ncbi:MAG: Fe-S cluster assembly protein SufD [Flavobacteriales bacterium]|jgi:Fe-S cluster assembly protein SufD
MKKMVDIQSEKKEKLLAPFDSQNFISLGSLSDLRRSESRIALNSIPLPHSRQETWKYTRTGKVINTAWNISHKANDVSVDSMKISGLECYTVVYVNGQFSSALSDDLQTENGLEIYPLSQCDGEVSAFADRLIQSNENDNAHIFNTFNGAFWTDGLLIKVDANVEVTKPVHIVHLTSGNQAASVVRHAIVVEESSKFKVIQSFSNAGGATFCNSLTEAWVAENSQLNIDKIQADNAEGVSIAREDIRQESNSTFHINTITASGGFVRNDLAIVVDGENCMSNLYAAYAPQGKEHVDNHTLVDHRKAHCESNEAYKGIVYDQASGVFNGKVFVRQDAQKTNAFQQNANILMSDSASMNSKPELEIYADDVKCSHGSTTGQFDEEAVFYLKARGISDRNARQMLVQAFVGDVLDQLEDKVRAHVSSLLRI